MSRSTIGDPYSKQFLVPAGSSADVTVVGILGDTRNNGLRDATLPAIFVPYTLLGPSSRALAVRTAGEPMAMLNTIRREVTDMDREVPLGRPITLETDSWVRDGAATLQYGFVQCLRGVRIGAGRGGDL